MLDAIESPGFGRGLNLKARPASVDPAEAIDLLNVQFTESGAVGQRSGYDSLTSSALTNRVASLEPYYTTGGTRQLVAGCGTRLEAINTSGAVVDSETGLTDGIWDFARFGAPGAERIYAGNGKNLLYEWDGSTWDSVANSPKARYLAVMAVDQGNRMVAGGFDDNATSGPSASQVYTSQVWFSDPGDPTSWDTSLQFTPGDGEAIQNVIAWREFVFVFKETKFFVVTGTSVVEGVTEVNYYTVDTGVGLASPRAVATSPGGVYFMSRDGVYLTNGGEPEQVSDLIDPIWEGGASPFYTGGVLAHGSITNCAMHYHAERLYLAFPTSSSNDRVLVHDPRYGWWSLWDIPASCLATFRIGSQPELVFGYASGSNHIGRHSSAYTNDDGSVIESHWRSGFQTLGRPEIKVVRQAQLWGTGVCRAGISVDYARAPSFFGRRAYDTLTFSDEDSPDWQEGNWQEGTWGGARTLNTRFSRTSAQGTTFSLYLGNNTLDQSWSVHEFDWHLLPTRPAGASLPR